MISFRECLIVVAITLLTVLPARGDVIRQGLTVSGGGNPLGAFTLELAESADNTATVRVRATGGQDVRGYGFVLDFDPDHYAFVEAGEGPVNLLRGAGASPLFLARNHAPGRVAVGAEPLADEWGPGTHHRCGPCGSGTGRRQG